MCDDVKRLESLTPSGGWRILDVATIAADWAWYRAWLAAHAVKTGGD